MTTHNTEKNYASLRKKFAVAGAVAATVTGLLIAQNLTQVKASENSEYIAVTDFTAGKAHATILSNDGKAYSRGWNNQGQLGVATGSKVDVEDWTEITLPEKLVQIDSSEHTVAIGESGKLYTWGPNANGQVGNGNTNVAFNPTQVTAVDRYSKIASGDSFTLALDSDGRLWSWGANNAGQLGDGTTEDRSTPKMVGGDNRFKEVFAAKETAYAIATDGTLWAWGSNSEGQIGDGTTDSRTTPEIVRTSQTWKQLAVSVHNNTVLAVDSNGVLYSWGSNKNALLGNGTDWRKLQEEENARFKAMIEEIERADAARRAALIEQCVDVDFRNGYEEYEEEYEEVSEERDKALEEARKKKEKEEEEKKNPRPTPTSTASPTPTPSPTETPIPDPDELEEPVREDFIDDCTKKVDETFAKTDTSGMKPAVIKEPALKDGHQRPEEVVTEYVVSDISVGSENAFMVDGMNRLHAWGKDINGQTGLDLEDEKSHTQVPVMVQENVSAVTAGDRFGAAVAMNGDLLVWGTNTNGVLLSDPEKESKLLKPTVKGSGYSDVIAGVTTVYGFKDKTAYAWGNNENGELGVNTGDGRRFEATPIERKVNAIAPGSTGAVALGTGNELLYWGTNNSGQFGNSETSADALRNVSSNTIENFTSMAAGGDYTLAVSTNGRVWGWGANTGKLLDLSGNDKNKLVPVGVGTGLEKVIEVAAGKNVSAVTDGQILIIWNEGTAHSYDLTGIVELTAGENHVVARTENGEVWNWSADGSGVRSGTEPRTLTQVDDRTYVSVAAGGSNSAGVTDAGETVIWGSGSEALRLGGEEGSPLENFEFEKVSLGEGYVLASDRNGVLWGWGENRYRVLDSQSVREFPTVLTVEKENNDKEGKK